MKISANDSPTTARMPQRKRACGACSREDPQPKLLPTSSTRGLRLVGVVERVSEAAFGGLPTVVFERVLLQALERDGLQEPRRE